MVRIPKNHLGNRPSDFGSANDNGGQKAEQDSHYQIFIYWRINMLKLSYAKCVIISMTNFSNFLGVRLDIL